MHMSEIIGQTCTGQFGYSRDRYRSVVTVETGTGQYGNRHVQVNVVTGQIGIDQCGSDWCRSKWLTTESCTCQ